jgi:hypothetical protein
MLAGLLFIRQIFNLQDRLEEMRKVIETAFNTEAREWMGKIPRLERPI